MLRREGSRGRWKRGRRRKGERERREGRKVQQVLRIFLLFVLATYELTFQQELAIPQILSLPPPFPQETQIKLSVGRRVLPLSFHGNKSDSIVTPLSYLNQHNVNKII